jgi:hypothetical protein
MDVITMPSTHLLLETLAQAYPAVTLQASDHFEWQPAAATIMYDLDDPLFAPRLLHEFGHATLKHSKYDRDIGLIAMERDAWQIARVELAPKLSVDIPGDIIHHDMDTYRDWLHARSTCPHCQSSGLQVSKHQYKCVTCLKTWRVNEARTCRLRRYRTTEH